MSKGTILVVEPDDKLRERLKVELSAEGYKVICESSKDTAISLISESDVLYQSIADSHDWNFVQEICSTNRKICVIAAVPRDLIQDSIGEFGIEPELITKPFAIAELKARIKSLLKRGG